MCTALIVDCWGIVCQCTDLHCASMGLQQATLCCICHEHIHVEQSFHGMTFHVNWQAYCHKEAGIGDYSNGEMVEPSLIYSTVKLFVNSKIQQGGSNIL